MSQETEQQEKILFVESMKKETTEILRGMKVAEHLHLKYQYRFSTGQPLEIVDADIEDTNFTANDVLLMQQQLQSLKAILDVPANEAVWNTFADIS